jgi:RecJ-like exonuclease
MSTTRERLIRLYREYREAKAERSVCPECRGTGMGTYGCCIACDGIGSWLTEWDEDACREAHVQHRISMNVRAREDAMVDRAIASQPHAWESYK